MKIVRVIARLNVGGPAKHVVWLTAGLQDEGFQSLLVAGMVPPGEDDMGYFATEMGVTPIKIAEMSREITLSDALSVWKIYRLLIRERPDIIHTHTAKAGTVGRVAALLYRWLTPGLLVGRPRSCRVVHTYHGHIFHSYYGPFKTRLFVSIERILARVGTDRLLVVSEQQRCEIQETFKVGRGNQFAVVPLGLDLDQFADWKNRRSQFRQELKAKPNDILIGIVGRLTEIKNHKLFFEAIKLFRADRGDTDRRVRFVVIGDGGQREKLEQMVEQNGLADDVTFVGSRRDLENIYPALDIVALTSLNEGTPLTLIEAMANARPVIATAVGGVVDLLGPSVEDNPQGYLVCERGIRVSSGDATAFARGMSRLVEDDRLRLDTGKRGFEFVTQHYRKERLLNDVRNLYRELLSLEPVTERDIASRERHIESRI